MYNRAWVVAGAIVFVALAAFPLWYRMGKKVPPLELELPTTSKECIEPTAFMRSEHMHLLSAWREAVVRNADLIYTATNGEEYKMNLHDTCMGCHTSKEAFCDRCHDYTGTLVDCWECHIAPGLTLKSEPQIE
jgi:hypothetical protein